MSLRTGSHVALLFAAAGTLAAVGCTATGHVTLHGGVSGAVTLGPPTIYCYEPASVELVASYVRWPHSRVEFYFGHGWTAGDLVFAFDFSRRHHRRWREVVYTYEHYREVWHETHHDVVREGAPGPEAPVPAEARAVAWAGVARDLGGPAATAEAVAWEREPATFAHAEKAALAHAAARSWGMSDSAVQGELDHGYDIGEVARVHESAEAATTDSALSAHHAEWALEAADVHRGDVAGLSEAVPDALEPDWTEAQEAGVWDLPAGGSGAAESAGEEPAPSDAEPSAPPDQEEKHRRERE